MKERKRGLKGRGERKEEGRERKEGEKGREGRERKRGERGRGERK